MVDFFNVDWATLRRVVGIIAAIVSFIAHPLYIWAIIKKETKPHFFTWFISSMIAGLSIFLFGKANGGEPVFMLIGDFIGLTIIAVISLFIGNGEKKDPWDWVCLAGALISIGVYVIYKNAFIAFIAILCAECMGIAPTARKTYERPEQEDFLAWLFTCAGNGINLLAVDWFNATDIVYVVTIFVVDGIVFFLINRRKIYR